MKNIITSIMLLGLTTNSFAAINHKKYQTEVKELDSLEKTSQHKVAVVRAVMLAKKLSEENDFDGLVSNINRTLTIKQKETVTNTYDGNASFKILFGLFGGSAHMGYDTVKILTTNPEDVAAFTSIKARDFKKLQDKIRTYIKKKETEIFYAKIFAAKALQLTANLPIQEVSQVYPLVMQITQQVSNVSFVGLQNITNCVHINYAERTNGWKLKLTGLISLDLGESQTQKAYRETTCSSEAIEHSISELTLHSVDLMLADTLLSEHNKALQLKIVDEAEAPFYPTWDSPYLQ